MKKIIIGVGVLILLIIIILVATGSFKFSASIGEKESAAPVSVVPEGWKKYTSGEFGYSIAYPDDWNLTDNNTQNSRDLTITAPQGLAFVRIVGFNDPDVDSVAAIEASMADYKASFANKPDEELKDFRTQMEGDMGYFAAAGFMAVGNVTYQFLERGMLATNGRVFIMRGGANNSNDIPKEAFEAHVTTVKQVMESFKVE